MLDSRVMLVGLTGAPRIVWIHITKVNAPKSDLFNLWRKVHFVADKTGVECFSEKRRQLSAAKFWSLKCILKYLSNPSDTNMIEEQEDPFMINAVAAL